MSQCYITVYIYIVTHNEFFYLHCYVFSIYYINYVYFVAYVTTDTLRTPTTFISFFNSNIRHVNRNICHRNVNTTVSRQSDCFILCNKRWGINKLTEIISQRLTNFYLTLVILLYDKCYLRQSLTCNVYFEHIFFNIQQIHYHIRYYNNLVSYLN